MFVSKSATLLTKDHMRDHKPRSKLILSKISNENDSMSTRVDGASTSSQNPYRKLREPHCSRRVISHPTQYMGLTET